ncbi:MAG: hypothetical protein U7126_04355 [Microcoleus sp.]
MNCSDIPKNYDRHFRTRQRNSAIANHNLPSTVTVAQLLIIPLCDRAFSLFVPLQSNVRSPA